MLYPCSSMGSPWAPVLQGIFTCSSMGSSGGCSVGICSSDVELLLLLWPWCSTVSQSFCPFLNMFFLKWHQLGQGALQCPVVGLLELAGTGHVQHRAAPILSSQGPSCSPLLPTSWHLHSTQDVIRRWPVLSPLNSRTLRYCFDVLGYFITVYVYMHLKIRFICKSVFHVCFTWMSLWNMYCKQCTIL